MLSYFVPLSDYHLVHHLSLFFFYLQYPPLLQMQPFSVSFASWPWVALVGVVRVWVSASPIWYGSQNFKYENIRNLRKTTPRCDQLDHLRCNQWRFGFVCILLIFEKGCLSDFLSISTCSAGEVTLISVCCASSDDFTSSKSFV